MKKYLLSVSMMILTACGSGGGGGSANPTSGAPAIVAGCTDSTATNYNPLATVNDGSCIGGSGGVTNGQASYYGFSTSGLEIDNETNEPSSAGNIVVSGKFFTRIDSGATRSITAAVFQPVCSMTPVVYSAVLISDTNGANAITVSVNPYAPSVQVTTHSLRPNTNQRYDQVVGTASAVTSCADGKVTDALGREIYTTSEMMVMKDGSNIYVGVAQASLYSGSMSTLSMNPTSSYTHIALDACSLSGCATPVTGTQVAGGSGTLYPNDYISSGAYLGFLSVSSGTTIYKYANSESNASSHFVLEHANGMAPALVANLGSQRLLIGSMAEPNNCGPDAESEGTYCTGAVGLTMMIK